MRFNKVTRGDTGEYNCEVSTNDNFGNVIIKLTVLGESFVRGLGAGPVAITYFDKINNCYLHCRPFYATDITIMLKHNYTRAP